MEEILARLDAAIEDLESKSVMLELKGARAEAIDVVTTLMDAKGHLRRSRSLLRQVHALMQKGCGELVGPEEG